MSTLEKAKMASLSDKINAEKPEKVVKKIIKKDKPVKKSQKKSKK